MTPTGAPERQAGSYVYPLEILKQWNVRSALESPYPSSSPMAKLWKPPAHAVRLDDLTRAVRSGKTVTQFLDSLPDSMAFRKLDWSSPTAYHDVSSTFSEAVPYTDDQIRGMQRAGVPVRIAGHGNGLVDSKGRVFQLDFDLTNQAVIGALVPKDVINAWLRGVPGYHSGFSHSPPLRGWLESAK